MRARFLKIMRFDMCHCVRDMKFFSITILHRCMWIGVFQLHGAYRRASFGVFQFPLPRRGFKFMFWQGVKKHCFFIILSFCGLHFFALSELSGFLSSLVAVAS